jgi:heme A synthase
MKRLAKYALFAPGLVLILIAIQPLWQEIMMFLALILVGAPFIVDITLIPAFLTSNTTVKEARHYATIRLLLFVVQVPVLLGYINFPKALERGVLLALVGSALSVVALYLYVKNNAPNKRDE